jgi:hypothetical protein
MASGLSTSIHPVKGRVHYNTIRPHGSLGYKPPAPEVFVPAMTARSAPPSRPAPPHALVPKPAMH